ncbi:response regulator transcription factor [Saccharopolyspora erythraea]|uniref:Response regulator transcription factor n=1 Tax=Saccharopolyspora erythraea TaxID=1836 RepID=A0ABP3P6D0_SACER|nr:response regulator transcription factor [Saccharopolyspora erythraea]
MAIHASDALTRLGLTSYLGRDRRVTETDLDNAHVLVVTVKRVDSSTTATLRDVSADTSARLILVVEESGHADVSAALESGARAILWRRDLNAQILLQAIRAVSGGGGFFPNSLQGELIEQVQRVCREVLEPHDLSFSGVTNREIDVLGLVSEGNELKDIAQKLHFSERTVKNILYQFTSRFNLHNRAHAVSYAIRSGLI